MGNSLIKRICAAALGTAVVGASVLAQPIVPSIDNSNIVTVCAADRITLADMPQEYQYAADWIWNNRIIGEGSVVSHATIYDQIVAGKGTLNYIIRWQSYKTITLQQRKNLQQVLEKAINEWNDWLAGYENWGYDHVNVKIVGWCVLDKNSLLDLQPDETVYTDVDYYDPSGDINAGMADSSMPDKMPRLPVELYRYEHWSDPNYQYPGGYENRFDMHLTGSTGMIDMGGYGYYWGQQLSDNAVLGLADGTTSVHILEHEIGHGFGFTDFYGGEGESDGFPPGGFPNGGGSLMMAGSSPVITDFDGWFARYVWTKIAAEEGRFDLSDIPEEPTTEPTTVPEEPTTEPTTVPEEPTTEPTTIPEEPTTEPEIPELENSFTDTIISNENGTITFAEHGTFTYDDTHFGSDDAKNLAYYEADDRVEITFRSRDNMIVAVDKLELVYNSHEPEKVRGDVNADGSLSIADLVMMHRWLMASPNASLTDWKAGDLCEDDTIDTYDICLMRQEVISVDK